MERIDRDRDIAAKILFASQLKARSKAQVRCPACVAGKAKVQGGDAVVIA
jgi:Zn finger protein HypA/HybF involved in hydrogenase expression